MSGYRNTANVPASFATIGVASGTVVAADASRLQVDVVNDSANIVYLCLGSPALIGSGIRLNANGGTFTSTSYRGQITAISAVASSNVCYSVV